MTAQHHRETDWEARLAAAGAPAEGCPTPEDWHRAAIGELAAGERELLDAHAAACPACAAERDLARAFAAGPDPAEAAATAAGVAAIVARLEARPPHRAATAEAAPPELARRAPAPPEPAPPARGRLLRFPWRAAGAPAALAAAAALVLAIGLGYQALRDPAPPALPDRPAAGMVRGSAIDELSPAGELTAAPEELSWEPVAGAERYRLTLLAVDDRVLWQGEAAAPPAPLPEAVMPLSSAVVYGWRVEALDAGGRVVARSERTTFRIRPAPESPAER